MIQIRVPIEKIPKEKIEKYIQKVKNLLNFFPKDNEYDDDFYIRKANELYLIENRM